MFSFESLREAFRSKTEEEAKSQAGEVKLLANNPVFAELMSELWIDYAYEETASLNAEGVSLEERTARANEVRLKRLNLERMVSDIEDKLIILEAVPVEETVEEPLDIEEKE